MDRNKFCIDNPGARLLDEGTECFAFLADHKSLAAAKGAINITCNANKVRQNPLRVILNGLDKDAAARTELDKGSILPRIHQMDWLTNSTKIATLINSGLLIGKTRSNYKGMAVGGGTGCRFV